MDISLVNHSRGYSVTDVELCTSLVLLGTGMLYGRRHFQMLNRPNASQWHLAIAFIEMWPILGGIIALIEYALFRCGCFSRGQQQPALLHRNVDPLSIDPALKRKSYYIDLLKSKEPEIRPFGRARRCPWEQSASRDDVFFEELQYVSAGEQFIERLRTFNLPQEHQGRPLTWADLTFYHQPALYWAIYWQKLPFIESIITSEEGAKLLHRSYPIRTAGYAYGTLVNRPGLQRFPEYPIHHAVQMADPTSGSFPTIEAAEEANRNAMQIVFRLLELNANINQADGIGRTPLHIALRTGNTKIAKLLIREGGTVRFSPVPNPLAPDQMLNNVLEQDKLHELSQLCHDLDDEMSQEIVASTSLIPDLSKIVVRYLY